MAEPGGCPPCSPRWTPPASVPPPRPSLDRRWTMCICATPGAPIPKSTRRRPSDDHHARQLCPDHHPLPACVSAPARLYRGHTRTADHLAAAVRPALRARHGDPRLPRRIAHALPPPPPPLPLPHSPPRLSPHH